MKSFSSEGRLTTRLLAAVSIKTLVELAFVCVLVGVAATRMFHPSLRGAIDIADSARVNGWVYDTALAAEPLQVQLFVDGIFVAGMRADQLRTDLVDAGAAPYPDHGFSFSLSGQTLEAGWHSAQVYAVKSAVGRNLTLIPIGKSAASFEVK